MRPSQKHVGNGCIEVVPPDRVVIKESGEAVSTRRALVHHGVTPDIVFYRNDGWGLGAPDQYESLAYEMFKDEWTHFARRPSKIAHPIDEYEGDV